METLSDHAVHGTHAHKKGVGMFSYYTPVLEQTTNTESVSVVQYFVRSLPALTRREHSHRYPVHSAELEIEETRSPPSGGF